MKLQIMFLLVLLGAGNALAADGVTTSGDVRIGVLDAEVRDRTGLTSSSDSLRARIRMGLARDSGDGWRVAGRVAAVLDSRQTSERIWLRTYAPSVTGLAPGQATVDELYVAYRPDDRPWEFRVGRFQAAFGLDDMMKKSLVQNDSPNFDVTWTDGVWFRYRGTALTTDVILRHNARRGPSGTLRPPLDFGDGGARYGAFFAVQASRPVGPVLQRMVTVTWLPSALRPGGLADPRTEDYLAISARGAAEWPAGAGGMRVRVGAEFGYADNTPDRMTVGSGTGDADGLSWQASLSLMEFAPAHSVSLVHGRVADGWLVSSDFRPNEALTELRWAWRVSSAWTVTARIRRRSEIDLPAAVLNGRRTDDFYIRTTWKF
jgi:hypothetical protein